MAMPTNAEPRLYVDWYADGDYTDAIDDVTALVLGNPGIAFEWGRDTARSTAPPMIGAADCVLINQDRALSPENPSSPRYQFIKPGRPVKLVVEHGVTDAYRTADAYRGTDPYRGAGIFPLLVGHTDTFDQRPEWGERNVGMSALGTIARLRRKVISLGYLGATRTDTAVDAILTAADWPADKRVLHVSDSVMNGYWVDERPAWDCLVELLATEGAGAVFYEDPDGVFHWLNRNHRVTESRSVNPVAALHDGTGASGQPYSHLKYDPRWDDVVNRVTVTTTQRLLAGSPTVIWQLGSSITLTAGANQTIWARPQDPFQNAIAPVLTTDYTVSGGTVSITLLWQSGSIAKLFVLATTGTPTISNLQLRAYSFPIIGTTEIESSTVAPDEDAKTLKIAAWPQLDPNQAQAICDSYLVRYGESRPIIDVTFQNVDGAAMDLILDLRISDRVEITNQHLGLVGLPCYVERIKHLMTTGGRHEVTISCEPVSIVGSLGGAWDTAIWNTSVWGV